MSDILTQRACVGVAALSLSLSRDNASRSRQDHVVKRVETRHEHGPWTRERDSGSSEQGPNGQGGVLLRTL